MLNVTLKGEKLRFASLNGREMIAALTDRFTDYIVSGSVSDRGHIKAAARVGGGERTYITMRSTVPVLLGNGDTVFPQIIVKDQSYPGSALTVSYGLYRLVCSNGLMAFQHVATPVSIPHFKNRMDTLKQLEYEIAASLEKFKVIIDTVERAASLPVVNIKRAIEMSPVPNKIKDLAIKAIAAGEVRPEDNINTQWGLYNFLNELDRKNARRGSLAYLARDEKFNILQVAA